MFPSSSPSPSPSSSKKQQQLSGGVGVGGAAAAASSNDRPPLCVQGDSGLVLTTDPKPRLRWTVELHDRFVDAVTQLGGPDKATPKTIMRVMGVKGLTLYHLKSHLQYFSNGQSMECSAIFRHEFRPQRACEWGREEGPEPRTTRGRKAPPDEG
ncbi:hypothetical protein OsI_24022 [Oryza sativa Indica Group]|uniref:HTH myb-type domain-containing protein n=1 Tax=Oryza sativa subsp. indica TaxID=39946 RepID=A2YFX9_ORYSI|nr:hypothetical protein OsI_24022 [Oryza sativa Indica Group]